MRDKLISNSRGGGMELLERNILPTFWMENAPYDWDSLKNGEHRGYKKGEVLFLEGMKMENIFLIKKGRVKISINNENGDEKTVGYLGNNSIVGTSSLFNNAQYMFNATVVTDSSLLRFDKEEFIKEVMNNEKVMLQVFKIMSMRIRILTNHALDLSFNHSFKRLSSALLDISNTYGIDRKDGTIFIDFKITQRELGELIGTTWVTVSNHLKKLTQLGVIKKSKQNYIITNLEALERISEGIEF